MQALDLIAEAKKALQFAYAPYSKFKVGAALLTKNNKVYLGCNIENGAFSPSVCAERVAFYKAISSGENAFSAIAIVGKSAEGFKHFCSPCGVCRQVMAEFCAPDFKIYLGDDTKEYKEFSLKELLPQSFRL